MAREREERGLARREPEREWLASPWEFESASPWSLMRRISDEMDRIFSDFWGRSFSWLPERRAPSAMRWTPAVDVFRRGDNLIIQADLPGVEPEDVQVEATEDGITIRGQTKHEEEEEREGYYRSERRYGSFHRFIPLPEGVKPEGATANFRNGMLEVSLPMTEETKTKRVNIPIQVSEAEKAKAGQAKKAKA